MNRKLWLPGGKGGGGRYVALEDLVREYMPQEPQKSFCGPPDPGTDPFLLGFLLVVFMALGMVMCWALLFLSGKVV